MTCSVGQEQVSFAQEMNDKNKFFTLHRAGLSADLILNEVLEYCQNELRVTADHLCKQLRLRQEARIEKFDRLEQEISNKEILEGSQKKLESLKVALKVSQSVHRNLADRITTCQQYQKEQMEYNSNLSKQLSDLSSALKQPAPPLSCQNELNLAGTLLSAYVAQKSSQK